MKHFYNDRVSACILELAGDSEIAVLIGTLTARKLESSYDVIDFSNGSVSLQTELIPAGNEIISGIAKRLEEKGIFIRVIEKVVIAKKAKDKEWPIEEEWRSILQG